jgi:hypothetical protein
MFINKGGRNQVFDYDNYLIMLQTATRKQQ